MFIRCFFSNTAYARARNAGRKTNISTSTTEQLDNPLQSHMNLACENTVWNRTHISFEKRFFLSIECVFYPPGKSVHLEFRVPKTIHFQKPWRWFWTQATQGCGRRDSLQSSIPSSGMFRKSLPAGIGDFLRNDWANLASRSASSFSLRAFSRFAFSSFESGFSKLRMSTMSSVFFSIGIGRRFLGFLPSSPGGAAVSALSSAGAVSIANGRRETWRFAASKMIFRKNSYSNEEFQPKYSTLNRQLVSSLSYGWSKDFFHICFHFLFWMSTDRQPTIRVTDRHTVSGQMWNKLFWIRFFSL